MEENKMEKPVGDEFVIGEGFVVDETAYTPKEPKKPKKHKKKGVGDALLNIFGIISVSVILAFVCVLFIFEYVGIGFNRGHSVSLEVPEGASTIWIANELKEKNCINSAFMFRVYTTITGNNGKYKHGVYTFKNELGYSELRDMLIEGGESGETVEVRIPERATIDEIIAILEEKGVCKRYEFLEAMNEGSYNYSFVDEIPEQSVYYRFEGYLFPDTYEFYCYDNPLECATLAIDKMLAQTEKMLGEDIEKKAEDMGYTVHEILTMASIVELEASGEPEEMKNVAQVFYNRLNDWEMPLLGSSPTARYKYGKGRYDTNKNPGLPPGPYCSPSLSAIEAALNPNTECKAAYFVTDSNMNFYYTHSLQEHNSIIAKLKRENNWIYEYYD